MRGAQGSFKGRVVVLGWGGGGFRRRMKLFLKFRA